MPMNSCETLHLNLGVQLAGLQCAHPSGVHGCQNPCNLDCSATSNHVGRSQHVGFPHLGPTIHNLHHLGHFFHCDFVENASLLSVSSFLVSS